MRGVQVSELLQCFLKKKKKKEFWQQCVGARSCELLYRFFVHCFLYLPTNIWHSCMILKFSFSYSAVHFSDLIIFCHFVNSNDTIINSYQYILYYNSTHSGYHYLYIYIYLFACNIRYLYSTHGSSQAYCWIVNLLLTLVCCASSILGHCCNAMGIPI